MSATESIRRRVKRLYETNPNIHLNVRIPHHKVTVQAAPAVIRGVYPNIFCVEETTSGQPRSHSIQYTEILIGQIEIPELRMGGSV